MNTGGGGAAVRIMWRLAMHVLTHLTAKMIGQEAHSEEAEGQREVLSVGAPGSRGSRNSSTPGQH